VGDAAVGLTRDTILAAGSDRQIAYKLILAKVNATLNYSLKNRQPLAEFKADWEILNQLQTTPESTVVSLSGQ
jgi:hypothetical protein